MKAIIPIAIVGIIFLLISFSGCSQIEAGFVGVKTRWGRVVSDRYVSEGLELYNPISDNIVKYDCRTRTTQIRTSLYDGDNQDSTWIVSIRYHLDKDKVINLHNTVGKNYEETLFIKPVCDTLKNIVGKIKTDNIVHSRESICKEFTERVNEIVASRGIVIEQLTIDDIDLPSEYEKAILQKNVALQNKERQVYESEQAVTRANGESKAKIALAEGESKSMLIKAESEAKSIEIRAKALEKNQQLVILEAVNRWDGKLPVYMMSGSNVIPTFELNKKGMN